MKTLVTSALLVAALSIAGVRAQQSPAAPPAAPTAADFQRSLARTWKSLHDKILVMAKDTVFPDDKLGWKPHPDSRSVLDEFRHVTIGLEMTSALLKGDKFDYVGRDKADASKPKTRASVVSEMEAAIAVSYPLVEKNALPLLVGWLDHQGEHYGKLVSNYRMNNIVPPISRTNK